MSSLLRDRQGVSLAVACAVGAIVQLLLVGSLRDQGHFAKYPWFADEILSGRFHAERLGDLSPGYLLFMITMRAAGLEYETVRAIQIFMVAASALLCGAAARKLVSRFFWVAPLVIFGSSGVLLNATELEPETLILLLNSAALFFLLRSPRSTPHVVAAGVCLGLSAITRPVAVVIIAALVIVFVGAKERRRVIAVFLAAASVPIAAVVLTNWTMSRTLAIMDPGTVFYEGWNPLATGYAGVQPRVVNDIEPVIAEPDALHVAYRIVASRDQRRQLSREESNSFWQSKAIAYIRDFPVDALRLGLRKISFAAHAHDAHDLMTMWRKSEELRRIVWIPFSLPLFLALYGLAAHPLPRLARSTLVVFAVTYATTLVAFYVTVRQRNAVYPIVAIAAALGVCALAKQWQADRRRFTVYVLLLLSLAGALTLPNDWTREERHGWRARAETLRLARVAQQELSRRAAAEALAATFEIERAPGAGRPLLAAAATERLHTARNESDVFDSALAFLEAGRFELADTLLERLSDRRFVPHRETRAVSSLFYYRAVAALRRGDRQRAWIYLRHAVAEAAGDADVAALEARLTGGGEDSTEYHDRFTVALARARAAAIAGDSKGAEAAARRITAELPEWRRPRLLLSVNRAADGAR